MITTLFATWSADIAQAVSIHNDQWPPKENSSSDEGEKAIAKMLSSLSETEFIESFSEIVSLLGSGISLFAEIKRLKENPIIVAFANFLEDSLLETKEDSTHETLLVKSLKDITNRTLKGDSLAEQVLIEEAQRFIEIVHGILPIRLHVAKILSKEDEKKLVNELRETFPKAIPLIKTDTSLLGGMRLFVGDTLIDGSWMNRVQSFLSALS